MFTVFKKCLNPRATFTAEDVGKINEFVFYFQIYLGINLENKFIFSSYLISQ